MACLKQVIVVMKRCLSCLVALDSIFGCWKRDRWQLGYTMHVNGEYDQIMEKAERMDKKNDYGEKQDLFWSAGDMLSVLSL